MNVNDFTVSAVIPTIPERAEMLHRALGSVLAQSWPVSAIHTTTDLHRVGAAATRNRGLAAVDTEWVAFLDDDDTWYPHHIESLVMTAMDTDADLIYPWYDGINAEGILTTVRDGQPVEPFGQPFGDEQRQHLLTTANFIPVTVLVRAQLLRDVGGFTSPPWASADNPCEDWGAWVKLLEAGATFAHCPEVTWTWVGHAGHTSGRALTTT